MKPYESRYGWRSIVFLVGSLLNQQAMASSHREAPLISRDPQVDPTDLYVFPVGTGASQQVVIVGNFLPGMDPDSLPNSYSLAPEAMYEFVVNNRDEQIIYRFQIRDERPFVNPTSPLAFLPGLGYDEVARQYRNYALAQTYNLSQIRSSASGTTETAILNNAPVAPSRLGPATTDHGNINANGPGTVTGALAFNSIQQTSPAQADRNYNDLANRAIRQLNGREYFVGPRNDPFFADLGGIFDGLLIRPFHRGLGEHVDSLAKKNVFSFVMKLNLGDVLSSRQITENDRIFSVYMRSLRRRAGTSIWRQVARLANPLFNEAIVQLDMKDRYNVTSPTRDIALFQTNILNPGLAGLLNALYAIGNSTNPPVPNGLVAPVLNFIRPGTTIVVGTGAPLNFTTRQDLSFVYLEGIPTVNELRARDTGEKILGDRMRVNLNLPIGWPNGRTLLEDSKKTVFVALAQCQLTIRNNAGQALVRIGDYPAQFNSEGLITPFNCDLNDGNTADTNTRGDSGITRLAGTDREPVMPFVGIPHPAWETRGEVQ